MGRLIDPEEASLADRRIEALPIVNASMERLGLKELAAPARSSHPTPLPARIDPLHPGGVTTPAPLIRPTPTRQRPETGTARHPAATPLRRSANCATHHLRELDAAGATDGQGWANDMAGLLSDTWLTVLEAKAADNNALSSDQLAQVRTKYDAIIAAGHVANPPVAPSGRRGRPKRTKPHNLLLRLDNYADDVLRSPRAEVTRLADRATPGYAAAPPDWS